MRECNSCNQLNHLGAKRLRRDDVNLIPIRTPHTFIDNAQATDGYVWLADGNNVISSEVPSAVCHKHNTMYL